MKLPAREDDVDRDAVPLAAEAGGGLKPHPPPVLPQGRAVPLAAEAGGGLNPGLGDRPEPVREFPSLLKRGVG